MTPILEEHMLEFVSRSPDQTQRLGARLGALLQGGDIICLEGTLGAGKTCLAQGIGRGWGVGQPLISPTFVLVREYARPDVAVRLHHVDFYRISGAEQALGLGVDDFLGDQYAICVIEWAGRARSLMPLDCLWIKLETVDVDRRLIYVTAQGDRHMKLLHEFRRVSFGA